MGTSLSTKGRNSSLDSKQKINKFKRSKSAPRTLAAPNKNQVGVDQSLFKIDNRDLSDDVHLTKLTQKLFINQPLIRKEINFERFSKTLTLAEPTETRSRRVRSKSNEPCLNQTLPINLIEHENTEKSYKKKNVSCLPVAIKTRKTMQSVPKTQDKRITAFDFRKEGKFQE